MCATNDTEESLQNPHLAWDTTLRSILTAHPLHLVHNYFTRSYVHPIRLCLILYDYPLLTIIYGYFSNEILLDDMS